MNIEYYPTEEAVKTALASDEPIMAAIDFEGSCALTAPADDVVEHHIMLMKMGHDDKDIDRYFRIVYDKGGADWTFVCPPDYKNIPYRDKRIEAFYKDGMPVIESFLRQMGCDASLEIPKRYRRHFKEIY